MDNPHVRVYLDDNPQPIIDHELPDRYFARYAESEDGPHRLMIRAQGQNGREGVEEIPFEVHNGPGIVVSGLRPEFDTQRQGALYRGCLQHRRSVRSAPRGGALVRFRSGCG